MSALRVYCYGGVPMPDADRNGVRLVADMSEGHGHVARKTSIEPRHLSLACTGGEAPHVVHALRAADVRVLELGVEAGVAGVRVLKLGAEASGCGDEGGEA